MSSALVRLLAAATAALALASCRNEPGSSATTPAARAELSAVERAREFGLELRPAAKDGVPVRVVDAASGRPVADALVVTVDEIEFTYSDTELGMPLAGDLLRELGTAYATSADGIVTVAPCDAPQVAFAWSGRGFGRAALEVFDRDEHEIRVAPRDLEVEVVDTEGRSQSGVPILLGKCALNLEESGSPRGVTGADGRCTIAAIDLEQGVHRTCGRRDLLMVDGVVRTWEFRAVDAPVLEPVRFVLPPCGSLDVEIQDVHGKRLNALGQQLLAVVSGDVPGEIVGMQRVRSSVSRSRSVDVPVVEGRFRVDRVEVGMGLTIRVFEVEQTEYGIGMNELDSAVEGHSSVEVRSVLGPKSAVVGPTKPGEVVNVVLKTEIDPTATPVEEEPRTKIGVDFVPPSTPDEDAEVEEPPSSIALGVITDMPIDPCTLSARIDDLADPNEHDACVWIDVNGFATARSILPGRHSVAIVTRDFGWRRERELVRFDGVEVRAKEHLRDPRLLSIDLRGKLRRHHLEIVDGAGRPLSGWIVRQGAETGDAPDREWFDSGNYEATVAASDTRPVSILVERHRTLRFDRLPERGRVVLPRGIPVRITLDLGVKIPSDPPTRLFVGIPELPRLGGASDEKAENEAVRTVPIEPGGSADFFLPEPGDWRVVFLAASPPIDDDTNYEPLDAVEPTLHVLDRADLQRFTVAPVPQLVRSKP
jgi:hypothetical protein